MVESICVEGDFILFKWHKCNLTFSFIYVSGSVVVYKEKEKRNGVCERPILYIRSYESTFSLSLLGIEHHTCPRDLETKKRSS